jgi:predicted kinase
MAFVRSTTSRGRLIIVCGLPGSGKTTHAKALEGKLGAVRFCPDEWMNALGINLWDEQKRQRTEALQWELARELLKRGQTVIIEWGTWARSERDALRSEARALGAGVELHLLDAPIEVLLARLLERKAEYPPIQRSDLTTWAAAFEGPSPEEMALFDTATHDHVASAPAEGEFLGIAHAQLAMPAGQEAVARAFYCGVLGFAEEPKPENLIGRGGAWFRSGSVRLHLGVDSEFHPAKKAHPALLVRGLAILAARCETAGFPPVTDEPLVGFDRVYVFDPFGNRIELMEPKDAGSHFKPNRD